MPHCRTLPDVVSNGLVEEDRLLADDGKSTPEGDEKDDHVDEKEEDKLWKGLEREFKRVFDTWQKVHWVSGCRCLQSPGSRRPDHKISRWGRKYGDWRGCLIHLIWVIFQVVVHQVLFYFKPFLVNTILYCVIMAETLATSGAETQIKTAVREAPPPC